jgi:hypothetical protein
MINLRNQLLAAILLALSAIPALAQNNTGAGGGGLTAVAPVQMFKSAGAHQQLSVTSGAVVTLTVPPNATMAAFTVETASIRMLDDGASPTTTLGNLWTTGPAYYGGSLAQLKAMQFIAVSTTATLDVLYYTNN